jgi:hypothetical protein
MAKLPDSALIADLSAALATARGGIRVHLDPEFFPHTKERLISMPCFECAGRGATSAAAGAARS